jgi:hypothetical protein
MLCPKFYDYYDNQGDRPEQLSSPLVIGTIVDEVVMVKLEGKHVDFRPMLAQYRGQRIKFKIDDLDLDFVNLPIVEKHAKSLGWKGDDIGKAIKDFMKNQANLSDNQYDVLSLATWQSIDVKIEAMLAAFDKWIAPKIKKVISVQEHLNDGKTHGYLDFIAETTDGKTVLFDLKTSKTSYPNDAVMFSPQLSLYAEMKNVDYAGYIVLVKSLSKNKIKTCPECDFKEVGGNRKKCPTHKVNLNYTMKPTSYAQYIVNEIPRYNKRLTKTAMYDTIKCIDNGVFPRNLNTCKWVFGEECQYINKCWKGKNEKV